MRGSWGDPFFQFSSVAYRGRFVMRTVSEVARVAATEIIRPHDRDTDRLVGSVLSDIAKTLWPTNTAPHIAAEITKLRGEKCAVRTVERYLADDREWSGDAIAVIVSEIMRRHAMRNFSVKPKR
jgi:hypothetical protein